MRVLCGGWTGARDTPGRRGSAARSALDAPATGDRGAASQSARAAQPRSSFSHCSAMIVFASRVAASAPSRSSSGQRTISMRSFSSDAALAIAQPGRVEDVDDLVGHARARHVARDLLPPRRGLADLLGQLALRGLERRLALLVEPPGRDLEEVGVADRLARLAHEPEVRVVVGDDRRPRPGGG